MKKNLIVLIIIVILATVMYVISGYPKTQTVACTQEALICPDGSAVGRSGPKCEFAPCPTSSIDKQNLNRIKEKTTTYVACGCDCCGGTTPQKKCLYHSKGDNIDTIIQQDKSTKQNPRCSTMGCSIGTEYSYCD